MGVPKRSVSVPEQETHFDCLPLRDHKPPQQTKWLRVQDQRRPRRAAPTSSPSFPKGRSRSSRRLSVSWTQTRMVSCPPVTLLPLFNSVGKSVSDGEAQGMLSEAPGPVNFTQMVMLFAEKMAGGADDDDTILKAFDAFEVNGKIDAEMFKHSLMTFGDKFTSAEVDNAFGEFVIEDGMIDAVQLKGLMVSKKEEEEE